MRGFGDVCLLRMCVVYLWIYQCSHMPSKLIPVKSYKNRHDSLSSTPFIYVCILRWVKHWNADQTLTSSIFSIKRNNVTVILRWRKVHARKCLHWILYTHSALMHSKSRIIIYMICVFASNWMHFLGFKKCHVITLKITTNVHAQRTAYTLKFMQVVSSLGFIFWLCWIQCHLNYLS